MFTRSFFTYLSELEKQLVTQLIFLQFVVSFMTNMKHIKNSMNEVNFLFFNKSFREFKSFIFLLVKILFINYLQKFEFIIKTYNIILNLNKLKTIKKLILNFIIHINLIESFYAKNSPQLG